MAAAPAPAPLPALSPTAADSLLCAEALDSPRTTSRSVLSSRRVVAMAPRSGSGSLFLSPADSAARAQLEEALGAEGLGSTRPSLVPRGLIRRKASSLRQPKSDKHAAHALIRDFRIAYSNAKLAAKWREAEVWAITDVFGVEMDAARAAAHEDTWNQVGSRIRSSYPDQHGQLIRDADDAWKTLRNERTTAAKRVASRAEPKARPILKRKPRTAAAMIEGASPPCETPTRAAGRGVRFDDTCKAVLFNLADSPGCVLRCPLELLPLKDVATRRNAGSMVAEVDGPAAPRLISSPMDWDRSCSGASAGTAGAVSVSAKFYRFGRQWPPQWPSAAAGIITEAQLETGSDTRQCQLQVQ